MLCPSKCPQPGVKGSETCQLGHLLLGHHLELPLSSAPPRRPCPPTVAMQIWQPEADKVKGPFQI